VPEGHLIFIGEPSSSQYVTEASSIRPLVLQTQVK